MFTRVIVTSGALLGLVHVAFAADTASYQKTRDGKTTVWNSEPKPGDEVTWSGGRDGEGYARGFGTATWYTVPAKEGASSSSTKHELYARFFGNMVHGKLDGPVNVHAKGKTDHAIFVDGVRTTRWAHGTIPSWRIDRRVEHAANRAVAEKIKARPEPEAPAEGPRTAPRTDQPADAAKKPPAPAETASADDGVVAPDTVVKRTEPKRARPPRTASAPKTAAALPQDGSKPPADDSLGLLTGPPRSLHVDTKPIPASAGPARLTKAEVIDLADAQALSRGFSLGGYSRPEPQYNETDGTWSINYEQSAPSESEDKPTHFSITVDDQTKGTVFVPGK
jgi:hypothetical protein